MTVPANGQSTAQVTATQGSVSVNYTGTLGVWYKDGTVATFPLVGTYAGIDSYNVVVTYATDSIEELVARRNRQLTAAAGAGSRRVAAAR